MTQKQIFVVDDEKVIADTLCAILRGSGYDATAFYDAESTLASCNRQRPDFVITDVSMPGMNGIEMAVQLRDRFPGCGILLFSGQAGTLELLESARQQGYGFELLTKPVHPKDLLAKLEGATRRSVESDGYLPSSEEIAS
jgi:CheY-like chemotaxis protein